MDPILLYSQARQPSAPPAFAALEPWHFHESLPGYAPTPLVERPGLAALIGAGKLWVKDESHRFGLKAFKALGGTFAAAMAIAGRLGLEGPLIYEALRRPAIQKEIARLHFITATDGNHGRGVAFTARLLGARSHVLMPRGSSQRRLENIRQFTPDAEITDLSYDDTVRLAARIAEEKGWLLLQDTAWEGYTQIPDWIMAGYFTLCREAALQLNGEAPTHIFLQAGVGSFPAAAAEYFSRCWQAPPQIWLVEPHGADCCFRSLKAGHRVQIREEMHTVMAGLACGTPSLTAFPVLRARLDGAVSCPDEATALGMRLLAAPIRGDTPVISGESGAVTCGLAALALADGHEEEAAALGLDASSRILVISTEGDTDPEHYQSIITGGELSSCPAWKGRSL